VQRATRLTVTTEMWGKIEPHQLWEGGDENITLTILDFTLFSCVSAPRHQRPHRQDARKRVVHQS
jgi:hypothetical protein